MSSTVQAQKFFGILEMVESKAGSRSWHWSPTTLMLGILFLVICVVVYSFNLSDSQTFLYSVVNGWVMASASPTPLATVSTIARIERYIQTLSETVYSRDMMAAYVQYEANPDVMLSVYYQIPNTSYYLIGAIEATVIEMPELSTPCVENPLFSELNISCMMPYKVGSPGPIIEGQLATYSESDGTQKLVYDLSNFSSPLDSRMTALQFNVYSAETGDVAITKVIFERSVHGQYVSSSSVTVIPQHFYHFGGSGAAWNWALVVGQFLILVASCAGLLCLMGRRIVEKQIFVFPSATEVSLFVLSVMCISSFGIQYTAITSGPLNNANIGVVRSVNLSETAAQFNSVNSVNALIIMLLFAHCLVVFLPLRRAWFLLTAIALVVMVIFSVLLNIRFPSILSFKEAFDLLTRISLRYLLKDFSFLSGQKFEMTCILVFYAFTTYWITGLFLGYFLGHFTSAFGETPTGKVTLSASKSDSYDDDQSLVTSLEVVAGRAVTEMDSVKAEMDEGLEAVHRNLIQARRMFRDLLSGDDVDVDMGKESLPSYVKRLVDGSFQCLWCDSKQLASLDFVEAHLRGKEHTKRCVNCGISPYGSSAHCQEAAEYISLYGMDPWARLKHWPACIVERGMFWECSQCGGKKFQTQRAVNEHLLEKIHNHQVQQVHQVQDLLMMSSQDIPVRLPMSTEDTPREFIWQRDAGWPACIVEDGEFWGCTLCKKRFNSNSTVDAHLKHPRHVASASVENSVRARALAKDRLEKLGRSINIERKECYLCERSFGSISEVEQHFQDLHHIANWYESTTDCVMMTSH